MAGTALVSQNGSALTGVSQTGSLADPYLLGALGNQYSTLFTTLSTAGSFTEYATFSVPAGFVGVNGATATYALTVITPTDPLNSGSITGMTTSLFSGTPSSPGTNLLTTAAGTSFTLPLATAGNYFLRFTGTVAGVGAQYSAALTALAVPEPGTYALMLSGALAVVLAAGRRRQRTA